MAWSLRSCRPGHSVICPRGFHICEYCLLLAYFSLTIIQYYGIRYAGIPSVDSLNFGMGPLFGEEVRHI